MHFSDQKVNDAQNLTIVVYKHKVCGIDGEQPSDHIELQNIFQCAHYNSYDIVRLHFEVHHILKEPMAQLEAEHWYAVELEIDINDEFIVKDIRNVDDESNPLYRLH